MNFLHEHAMEKLARDIAMMYFTVGSGPYYTLSSRILDALTHVYNSTLDEAAQLAEDIDSGKYTATKTTAEAIREMKVR